MTQTINAVGVIFEKSSGEILVLKRNSNKPDGNKWGLSGGKVEPGEIKVGALVREVNEEINLSIEPDELVHLKTYKWLHNNNDITFSAYKINITNDINISLNSDESSDYKWFNPKTLYKKYDLIQGLYIVLKDTYNL